MCFNDNHVVCPRISVGGCRTKNWPVYANASVRPTLSGPGARYAASLAKIEHISSPHCRVGPGSVNQIKMEQYRQHLGQALPNTPPSQVFLYQSLKHVGSVLVCLFTQTCCDILCGTNFGPFTATVNECRVRAPKRWRASYSDNTSCLILSSLCSAFSMKHQWCLWSV